MSRIEEVIQFLKENKEHAYSVQELARRSNFLVPELYELLKKTNLEKRVQENVPLCPRCMGGLKIEAICGICCRKLEHDEVLEALHKMKNPETELDGCIWYFKFKEERVC